jgi:hypothetical protein
MKKTNKFDEKSVDCKDIFVYLQPVRLLQKISLINFEYGNKCKTLQIKLR